ncbi:hypothetical protein [Actinomadura rubrisoli]|uniref:Uncharacterized protein n=1 Tax=Actinomadura rubrisoli TaxID=2530368 RepID=A0A4V2YRL2_9ACTN|nr:hypothetical protein [Actinomadura rubrisoli]TDD66647.1 hypothetical protein E1298_40185 [Actinomadura rubrisoli]
MSRDVLIRRTAGLGLAAALGVGLAAPAAGAATAGRPGHAPAAALAAPAAPAAPAQGAGTPKPQVTESAAARATLKQLKDAGVPADEIRAAAWRSKTVKLRWCWGERKPKVGKASGWRCSFLGAWVDMTFVYNGRKVYQHRVACDDRGVYNVNWTWCGYTRNGKPWMSAGGNFRTRLGIGNVNVSYPYWMRLYVNNRGKVTSSGARS